MYWGSSILQLLIFFTLFIFFSNAVMNIHSILKQQTFSVIWNMPTSKCHRLYGVSLDLEQHGIIYNVKQKFQGENISLFYERRLGLYPYISQEGLVVNGGVPQDGDLNAHLAVMASQIHALMRKNFSGLAVLDWEKWQPLWIRNFGTREIYNLWSKQLIRQRHPEMSEKEVTLLARTEFERAAKAYMEETLRLGVEAHPNGLWGYYGFPSCYNDHGSKKRGYTGKCKANTELLNDRLTFLWQHSTALYPSVYVRRALAGNHNTRLMVRHRVLEAFRVATQHGPCCGKVPTLPYARVAFIHSLLFLNQTDLENTLGEIAALGAPGVVVWGDLGFAKSKKQCILLRDYISSVLGVYIDDLHRRVTHCSRMVCSTHGRCMRRNPHSGHMLPEPDSVAGFNTDLKAKFKCDCYEGWSGERCEENNKV